MLGPVEHVASPTDELNGSGRIVVPKLCRELRYHEPQLVAPLQAGNHFTEDLGSTVLNISGATSLALVRKSICSEMISQP